MKMPRNKAYDTEHVATQAMHCFWRKGYCATTIEDLVMATGVNRHGLYNDFVDKRGLFLTSLHIYSQLIVSPAFSRVEGKDACMDDIRSYFHRQIDLAERSGLPGPGCLMANTMVEIGPHAPEFMALVQQHLERLQQGFAQVLLRECQVRFSKQKPATVQRLAWHLTISAQGLWSLSRSTKDLKLLTAYATDLVDFVEERIFL
jgi:TetR/AcrR family transcriptional regulator, transcriptional repressor for nem operon